MDSSISISIRYHLTSYLDIKSIKKGDDGGRRERFIFKKSGYLYKIVTFVSSQKKIGEAPFFY